MMLDLQTTRERTRAQITGRGERHQLHWAIQDGAITPRLTCLHGDLPADLYCAAQTLAECPELLAPGYAGSSPEIRDGIMISRWRHSPCWPPCAEDDGPEFLWHYEDEDLYRSVATQRHTVRFVLGEEQIEPVFECLHGSEQHCHVGFWRDEIWLFPEWHAGPDRALRAGTIVSWWATGAPSTEELPYWAYEGNADEARTALLTHNTK